MARTILHFRNPTPPMPGGVRLIFVNRRCNNHRRRYGHYFFATRFLRGFLASFPLPEIAKSSIFFPDLIAAASQRGFSPRPAHVSAGFSGLRYFGATFPLTPRPMDFERVPPDSNRLSFASSVSSARRSSDTFDASSASMRPFSPTSASIVIDFKFIFISLLSPRLALYRTDDNCKHRIAPAAWLPPDDSITEYLEPLLRSR